MITSSGRPPLRISSNNATADCWHEHIKHTEMAAQKLITGAAETRPLVPGSARSPFGAKPCCLETKLSSQSLLIHTWPFDPRARPFGRSLFAYQAIFRLTPPLPPWIWYWYGQNCLYREAQNTDGQKY
eukprot:8018335-Karenia_brevis.AAC.1